MLDKKIHKHVTMFFVNGDFFFSLDFAYFYDLVTNFGHAVTQVFLA